MRVGRDERASKCLLKGRKLSIEFKCEIKAIAPNLV